MARNWPRGSEWRKWDLHLHSPGTKLNDQFKVDTGDLWDKYCECLENSDVHAFGITDYFSADGYFRTLIEFERRYPESEKILFPNIELRTGDVVNKKQEEVNVHLIFDPSQPDYKSQIEEFLRKLKTTKTKGTSGRNIFASELNNASQIEEATTTRAFILKALDETYGKNVNLLDYLLIITASNNDGIRAERGKKRKLLISDEIDKFSDAFFGNAKNVKYFLSDTRAEDKNEFIRPKPVLSGSDAHSFDDLEKRLGRVASTSDGISHEPTWIKSDLTFEGLKQIVFEPKNRVYIGAEPDIERRVQEHSTKYIAQLDVTCIDGYEGQHGIWFKDEQIFLGKELVAIIGNKGSGKSAITDIIGLLGNSHNQTSSRPIQKSEEVLFSFLNKEKFLKRGYAQNFRGTLIWHSGKKKQKSLDEQVSENVPERVEYLPQKYLERICTNIADDEFRTTLNEVVFRYVKSSKRYGQSDLDGLINYLTQQTNEDIQNHLHELHKATEKLVTIEHKLTDDYREKIESRLLQKKEERNAHLKTAPEKKEKPPSTHADSVIKERTKIKNLENRITQLGQQIDRLESERIELTEIIEELNQARQEILRKAKNLTDLETQYRETFTSVGLVFRDIVDLSLDFDGLDNLVLKKKERLDEIEGQLLTREDVENMSFEGETDQQKFMSKNIRFQKEELEHKKTALVKSLSKPEHEYQAYVDRLAEWNERKREIEGEPENPSIDSLKGLQQELENIQTAHEKTYAAIRMEQIQIGKGIFRKKKDITGFYSEIKQSIDAEIEKYRNELGDYAISVEVGLQLDPAFIDTFLDFINHGISGSFYGVEEGRVMLQKLCATIDDWENEEQVFKTLKTIIDALHVDMRDNLPPEGNNKKNVFKQMKQDYSIKDIYNYLYGFDYLKPKYDLKVDQKNLSELSPGERGGLLLIFYLMLDRQDIPLVIDQPEDNLDNKSVYEILVKFIKQAKKRRQIIFVTHNPNLAVVADAEQIIHVSINKKDGKHEFDFLSGSIEDPEINRLVVDILEGTLPAFDNRRLKYRKQ